MGERFLYSCLQLSLKTFLILSLITAVNGYIKCRSTAFYEADTICTDSEYCCGTYLNKCCYSNQISYSSHNDFGKFTALLVLAFLIGCPIWCCWCCCCRKTKSGGVVYNPVAAVPQTTGNNQLPSQSTGEPASVITDPNMSQPNPYSKLPPYPVQQVPYPGQQTPYPLQPMNYPQQVPYPTHPMPYPSQQAPYPNNPAPYPSNPVQYPPNSTPYPSNPAPYPTFTAPYPANSAPYPGQQAADSAQQTLCPSNLDSLYPAQEPTNPYFRMPPPAYNEAMQQTAPSREPTPLVAALPPSAPPP